MDKETIFGDVIGKANNYMIGKDARGNQRIIKNDRIKEYEKEFIKQCSIYRGRGITGRFKFYADVFYSSNSFDLDNSLKTLLDCLQYVKAIKNDALCVGIIANKHIDQRNPRVVFGIEELEPKLNLFK